MAENIVHKLSELINQQIDFMDKAAERIRKTKSLAQVALCDHFLDHPDQTIHYHLWTLKDLVAETEMLNDRIFKAMLEGSQVVSILREGLGSESNSA